jgi:hypothetical protein
MRLDRRAINREFSSISAAVREAFNSILSSYSGSNPKRVGDYRGLRKRDGERMTTHTIPLHGAAAGVNGGEGRRKRRKRKEKEGSDVAIRADVRFERRMKCQRKDERST